MKKPLAIDIYAGVGGWTEGLLSAGWDVVGFDIERHIYGQNKYPSQLVIQDARTLHGKQFRDASLIVASPPCIEYSYMAMPWTKAKKLAQEYRDGTRDVAKLTELFDACFRIQREACEAAGRHIPLIVENVRGAQPWVGRSRWNYGSFHLFGDVPALMPMARAIKNSDGSWFGVENGKPCERNDPRDSDGVKVPGLDWSGYKRGDPNYKGQAFNTHAERQITKGDDGVKFHESGSAWWRKGHGAFPSKSSRRKAASAMIAKIPRPLAQYIGEVFHPGRCAA